MYKRLFPVVAGLALLAACGGGGSSAGGGSDYTGATTPAAVTTSNAKALSSDAYSGSQLSVAASGVAKVATDSNGQSALLQQAAGILKSSVTTIVGSSNPLAKVVAATAQNTVYGYSGSFAYSITYDQASGAFSGTITFSQYKDGSTSPGLAGSIAFSGDYNQATDSFTSLNISMSSLVGTVAGKSYGMAGSVFFNTSGASETVRMSVVLTDKESGRTYWVKDYFLVLTGTTLTVTGTYYDPIHGYVILSTVNPLTVSTVDAMPTSGQLLFTGSNGTKARLTFTGGVYTVEVDTVGNETYVVVP